MRMRLFAISDLHLSGSSPKPMDIFGWENHWEKIQADWSNRVAEEDLVLIGGDISWAMQLQDAQVDLEEIGRLPGKKLLLRGNHDYWWGSLGKVRSILPTGMQVLQNDAFAYGDWVIAGTRGWNCPIGNHANAQDEKIFLREVQRLELSLKQAEKLRQPGQPLIVMMHYPPFDERRQPSPFTDLMERYGVCLATYGHLHGNHLKSVFEGTLRGVKYRMVSCDYLQFQVADLTPQVEE